MMPSTTLRRRCTATLALLSLLVHAGCGALDVSDPTAIEDSELNDGSGADLLRKDALAQLYVALGNGAYETGTMSDEFFADTPEFFHLYGLTNTQELLDRRESVAYENYATQYSGIVYANWQAVEKAAGVALDKMRSYGISQARVGEVFAIRGIATLRLAEDYCPGFPIHNVVNYQTVSTNALSTDDALALAAAAFDTAITLAADSNRILQLARVMRARVSLAQGDLTAAAAMVTAVPTAYSAQGEYTVSQQNQVAFLSQYGYGGVADHEGGAGLDFGSADDPRVVKQLYGPAADGVTPLYYPSKYPDLNAPLVIASGIEARLIEAEATLAQGGDWLGILNTLRTTGTQTAGVWNAGTGGVAGLAPLTDPGSPDARVDLVFRERAFWLYGTGLRLADLRRLVRVYDRSADAVYPTGAYWMGGTFSTGTSVPFPAAREATFNPAITGCTSR